MLYNSNITYNNSSYTYSGNLIIKAPSLISPIVLNNIIVSFSSNEDYSNYTTIAIVSMDMSPSGILTLEVLDKDVSAISSAQIIAVGAAGEISIVG